MSTPEQLREQAAQKIRRAEALELRSNTRFDSAPGSAVTGGSGRVRSGLHKRTNKAIDGSLADLRKARALRDGAAILISRADRLDPVKAAAVQAHKDRRKGREKAEKAAVAALPLLNERSASRHITSAEWSKTPNDYKGISPRQRGERWVRVRTILHGGALHEVFLTDKPEKV